jgi:NAD+ kinase
MRIALFANELKSQAAEVLQDISHYLKKRGIEVPIEQIDSALPIDFMPLHSILKTCDFVVSIGGDGSILHLIHHIGIPNPPLIGVNLGSLGFLADIPVHDIFGGFDAICCGSYHISERLVIEGSVVDTFKNFAINEIAIHRGDRPNLIDLAIHVDGHFVNTFSADGMIVATPCGSTAYSLAAGGPIVTPSLSALILTPICPHTISNRPIVIMPKESVSIELCHGAQSVDVAFDGQPPEHLRLGETFDIRVSTSTFKLVTLSSSDFFTTLRTKLGWTGSLRKVE